MSTSDFLDSLKNSGKYDVGRYDSSRPSYVGRYEDGGRYVSVDGHQYYSDNDIILKYHPRTEGQRMSTAAHEAGHMLAYMVAIAMETDFHEFVKECANRISMVRVKNYADDTNCGGFINCNREYKSSHPDAYKRMLCGGAIGEWCEVPSAEVEWTKELVLSPEEAISEASKVMTIRQGDLIYIQKKCAPRRVEKEDIIRKEIDGEEKLYCKIK